MDKRGIIGIALCILVLVAYQEWITRYYGPQTAPVTAPEQKQEAAPQAPTSATPGAPVAPAASAATSAAPATNVAAKEITVETDEYVAVFTNVGARLKSFKFKKYRREANEKSGPFEMVTVAPGVPLPLGVRWQTGVPFEDTNLVYNVQGGDLKLTGAAKGTLTFQAETPKGAAITKSFTFSGATYPIQMDVAVNVAEGNAPAPEIVLTDKKDHPVPNPDAPFEGVIALVDNKIKRQTAAEAVNGQEFSGDVSWAGFGHTYFFFALVPQNGAGHKVSIHPADAALTVGVSSNKSSDRYTLYVGPKELDVLKAVGNQLERSIDFGYFGFVSIPFLYALHFFHRFTGSYGIDIILLTVVIKLLMWPLTHKSFTSMKQMQKLGPQMEKLKEKFANDKEKLNKEIMELYKRNGVNPLGGCLPMVLQFPVFIGLYNALSTPIELRHAPFMWVKDLSRPDWESLPFMLGGWQLGIPVLTLLMGASMFLQQWMTPSIGDPNQRKLMLLMPVMFTFMFVSFPAGLTVYWLINNLLSIAQQYWINRSDR
ncbi:MAG: membrane protein insertase YidC [Deltaproteobacteria bacterium]|nr:membrane protein insertase YidC [Deltaproteobacteria bacterium]